MIKFLTVNIAMKILESFYEKFPYPPKGNNHESYFKKLVLPYLNDISKDDLKICELGCGTGETLIDIAKCFPKNKILAVDINNSSIDQAKKKAAELNIKNIEFLATEIEQILDQYNSNFQFINCQGVLHHLENPQKGLETIYRLLSKNGLAFVWVYNKFGREYITNFKEIITNYMPNIDYDKKLEFTKDFLYSREQANGLVSHKKFLNRKKPIKLFLKISKIFEKLAVLKLSTLFKKFESKLFYKNKNKLQSAGLADEYFNPREYFYDLPEFINQINLVGFSKFKIIDGIAGDPHETYYMKNIINKYKIENMNFLYSIMENIEKPRGVGLLIYK